MRTVVISFFVCFNVKTAQTCGAQKKMRSTHACTPSFAPFFSIFTSVVVYSRTTIARTSTNPYMLDNHASIGYVASSCDQFTCNDLHSCAQHKKIRSTHACTPSFAYFFLNIHVGCCLFSHVQKLIATTKQSEVSNTIFA